MLIFYQSREGRRKLIENNFIFSLDQKRMKLLKKHPLKEREKL
jgi:hypothetical protein